MKIIPENLTAMILLLKGNWCKFLFTGKEHDTHLCPLLTNGNLAVAVLLKTEEIELDTMNISG